MIKGHVLSSGLPEWNRKYVLLALTLASTLFLLTYYGLYNRSNQSKPVYSWDDNRLSIVSKGRIRSGTHSGLNSGSVGGCRRNTTEIIELMRLTQRQVSKIFKQTIHDNAERYEKLTMVFGSVMSSFRYVLEPFKYYDRDEFKYFLEFSDPNSSCNHITLGVGGSWEGEKALRRKYPQCEMLGVDIMEVENRQLVESEPHSRYVSAFITEKEGPPVNFRGLDIPSRTILELLKTENHGKLVDFMTIDVEGAEFTILDNLKKKRDEFPVICQLNVEMHYGRERFGVGWDEFMQNLLDIIDEAHFIVLNVDERTFDYRKFFMINVENPECIKKFLC